MEIKIFDSQWVEWLVKSYPERGDVCYFGERLCTSFPWHIFIEMATILIIGYLIIYLMNKYRKGGLFGVPKDL